MDLIKFGWKLLAGNSFNTSQPLSIALTISDMVKQPGKYGIAYRLHNSLISTLKCGLTINLAPCNNASLAVSVSKTVPAPMIASSLYNTSIAWPALGVVYVTSITFNPP